MLWSVSSHGQIVLNSPTTDWYAITYVGSSRTDYLHDEQTGINESDLVGSAVGASPVQTAFYFDYDPVSNEIAFRVRVDGDSNPPGFTGAIWVGFLFDTGDSIDLFTGHIDKNSRNEIGFYHPGTGSNTSPSTTSIDDDTPIYSEAATSSNFLWTAVTVGPSGNDPVSGGTNDIGGDGKTDYFATWKFPFSRLESAALAAGNHTITANSTFRFVVGTSEQSNSMNQDLNGISGNTTSSLTFSALGAVSPTVSPSGGIVPEPQTAAMLIGSLAFYFLAFRRSASGSGRE